MFDSTKISLLARYGDLLVFPESYRKINSKTKFSPSDLINSFISTSFKYYLEMFDKYIVTSDDLYVRNGFNKREKLKENNFDIIDVNYGTNYKLARDIITKDLNYWKNKKQIIKHVPILKDLKEIISKEGYEKLITECNGDFEMIFESIKPIYYNYDYISNRDELEKNIFEFQKNKFKERMEYETKYKVKTLHL